MWKFAGAIVVASLAVAAQAHDSTLGACRAEARGLKGVELERYVKVCVAHARTVQAVRVASACRPSAPGIIQARACGPLQR
jgi:hypothetical protein